MNRTAAAAALALAALTLTSCADPGWEGTGTVTELEFIEPEREADTVDAEGLEVTVMLRNGQEATAMFVPSQECAERVVLGRNVTLADVEKHCGAPDYSTDD